MDGKGRWMDDIMIERQWRSLKYECAYLQAFETGSEARAGIGSWIDYCNIKRPHSALAGQMSAEAYRGRTGKPLNDWGPPQLDKWERLYAL